MDFSYDKSRRAGYFHATRPGIMGDQGTDYLWAGANQGPFNTVCFPGSFVAVVIESGASAPRSSNRCWN